MKALRWSLQHKKKTIVGSLVLLVTIIVLFALFNKGVEFFPNTEPTQVSVSIEYPSGTSLEITNAIAKILEERLQKIPGRHDIDAKEVWQ